MKADICGAVYIEWVDSTSFNGWHVADNNLGPTIQSVGWLAAEDKKAITISTSRGASGKYCDQLTIPRFAVTKLVRLK